MIRFSPTLKRTQSVVLALILTFWQLSVPLGIILANTGTASAASICTVDTAGANDEPGQKDLTQLCLNNTPPAGTQQVTWSWDELGTSGSNTLDACALFDTDGDGHANYAICVTTTGENPAIMTSDSPRVYSCGDAKDDRCTSTNTLLTGTTSTCNVSQLSTQPFAAGAGAGKDTVASCTLVLSDVGGSAAKLIDVCSFPSQEPGSDPSDCVIARANAGKLEVVKNLVPSTNTGLFNLQIDGTNKATDIGNNGTTGENVVTAGSHNIGETAGTNTSLASYSTAIVCRDLNGTGAIVAQGLLATLQVPVVDDSDIICTITNTAAGSITIVKNGVPNSLEDFGFTTAGNGLSNFSLDDDSGVSGADTVLSNTKTFNNLSAGAYTVTESAVSGWDLANIDCGNSNGVTINGSTASVTLTAGQNVTCTYTNNQRGNIVVTKQTNPDNDPSLFSVTAAGTGGIAGQVTRLISDNQSTTYDVAHGTYNITEQVPTGWAQTGNTCANLVINDSTPIVNGVPTLSCTITNTKYAALNIIKDALPNGAQDFGFTTTNLGGDTFNLDDDSDSTLPNNQSFMSLLPGSYSVNETSLPGWSLTGLSCDTNNYTAVGSNLTINLSAGQTSNCTFVNTKLVSIFGTKYTSSASGIPGPVLAGWTIFIDTNGDGIQNNGEASTLTDTNGNYSFVDLSPGTFTLSEVFQAGWTQIFKPATFILGAGDTATHKDFGNFQNGSISGFKWNDANGDGVFNNSESKLSGWTINLYQDSTDADTIPDQLLGTVITDVNGNYSFANLSPLPSQEYSVCEVQQAGWLQTFPANNSCHPITMDQSGENNTNTNFGNQGRGSVTVIKNVDTNGDGQVDQTNASDWSWDIDGQGNHATGSANSLPVAAGSYVISEDQKTNFHVISSSCTGETQLAASTGVSVTVSPGENIVCTFTNARDTGTLTLVKNVISDNGGTAQANSFNLHVLQNGTDVSNSPAAGSAAGTVYSLPTGSYSVSENSPVSGYAQTSIVCDGQTTASVTLTTGTNKTCTITNDDIAPQLTVIKHVLNDNSGTLSAANFTMNVAGTNVAPASSFPGSETGTTVTLNAGSYSVGETAVADYTSSLSTGCTGTIVLGQTKICTITNNDNPHPNIHIVKTGSTTTAYEGDSVTYTFTVTNAGDTPLSNVVLTDSLLNNATTFVSGDTNNDGILDRTETWVYTANYQIPVPQNASVVNVASVCAKDPAQTQVCNNDDHTIIVFHPTIMVNKVVVSSQAEQGTFDLLIDNQIKADNISNGGTTGTVLVSPGMHTISELAGPNTNLDDYVTTYSENCQNGLVAVIEDQNAICTITNTRKASVIVTKYNDYNRNGLQDIDEPLLPNWDFKLANSASCSGVGDSILIPLPIFTALGCNGGATQRTSGNGLATFQNVIPGTYFLDEVQQDTWHQTNMHCDDESFEIPLSQGETTTEDRYIVTTLPGSNVHCSVGNYQDIALNISKTNNRPSPTTVGDTVTYTIFVDVPANSGTVFNTAVQDLPPKNFTYIPGSWTARSSIRGDLKASEITTEPTYGSPGAWKLGTMLSGERVTLTYLAKIGSSVISGTYPDIAFGFGCFSPATCGTNSPNTVVANISTGASTPFVGTQVSILTAPIVPVNTTKLVNTGATDIWRNILISGFIVLITLATFLVSRPQKGGRA